MKRWATVVLAGGMLVMVGCGSSSSSGKASVKGTSKDEVCSTVKTIQTESQQATDDLASGKADMSGVMNKLSSLATRLGALAGTVEPGELQDAVTQWSAATMTQLNDPTEPSQTATFDARDRVDDLCGLPHGPR